MNNKTFKTITEAFELEVKRLENLETENKTLWRKVYNLQKDNDMLREDLKLLSGEILNKKEPYDECDLGAFLG